MGEVLFNYAIFFIVIIFIAVAATFVKRFRILSNLFAFFGKVFLLLLQLVMLLVFTGIVSMLVAMIILIHPFIYGQSQFFVTGEPLHFLAIEETALLQFSITYGVLYIILYFICGIVFAKTRVPTAFMKISIRIRRMMMFHSRNNQFERKVIGTAPHLMTSTILFVIYPMIISHLFPSLNMTLIGNITLYVILLLFSILPVPGYTNPWTNRKYSRAG